MLTGVPLIHCVHRRSRLSDRNNRPFCQFDELLVGNDRRDLDDRVGHRIQTRHLQIYPNQVAALGHGDSLPVTRVHDASVAGILTAFGASHIRMPEIEATVIATFSRRMRLRLDDATEVDARIKGKKLKPVCGDRVRAKPISDEDDWLITAIHKRRNELTRPNARGEKEVLAANVDQLVVVVAATPKPDWFIVDRYLCAAELMGVTAAVVYNKTDLETINEIDAALCVYEAIGYPTIKTSVETGDGIDVLGARLQGRTAIIVGQSGVGKSTLINRLSDLAEQKTAEISRKHREGRHTTVNSVMIPLPTGGAVIDSPGVRDYAPLLRAPEEAAFGYREVSNTGRRCQFGNCRHLREPGCAVKEAVDAGKINGRRYESYRRALALIERLTRNRY